MPNALPLTTEIGPTLFQRKIADYLRLWHPHMSSLPRLVMNNTTSADMSSGHTTAASPVTIFTVTGDVKVQCFAVVGGSTNNNLTSTAAGGSISLGTTEVPAGIIALSAVDGANFALTDVWVDTSPSGDCDSIAAQDWQVIGGGADIVLTISAQNITQGKLTYYCYWQPLSSDGLVVSA